MKGAFNLALEKTGYAGANFGTTKVNVGTDANGYIAATGKTVTGSKSFSINRVNAENSLQDNQDVLNFFIGLATGTTDSLSNTMQVKWGVNG